MLGARGMRVRLRGNFGNWLTGGLHFLILVFAAQAESAAVWPYALAAMALVSFAAWIGNYRRLRHISDTPTSRIASAAQGYVELIGRADHLPDAPLVSKLSAVPCTWYRYDIYRRTSDDEWTHHESGESDEPFVLRDETGQCIVDPEHAEIVTSHEKIWTSGAYRYTEWLLLPRDPLYVIGEFATLGRSPSHLDSAADTRELLAAWKKDQPRLLERFDLNRDGRIDLEEWELARRDARRQTEAHHAELSMTDGTHAMRCPADGRPFLISNYLPEKLHRRYQYWSSAHLVIFFGAGGLALTLY